MTPPGKAPTEACAQASLPIPPRPRIAGRSDRGLLQTAIPADAPGLSPHSKQPRPEPPETRRRAQPLPPAPSRRSADPTSPYSSRHPNHRQAARKQPHMYVTNEQPGATTQPVHQTRSGTLRPLRGPQLRTRRVLAPPQLSIPAPLDNQTHRLEGAP